MLEATINGWILTIGGDRIRPGTAKGDAYCARSAKIKGDWKDDPNSPNNLICITTR